MSRQLFPVIDVECCHFPFLYFKSAGAVLLSLFQECWYQRASTKRWPPTRAAFFCLHSAHNSIHSFNTSFTLAQRITPSYVKIPPGYPPLKSTGRTALGEEVLNDQYVNVITGRYVILYIYIIYYGTLL